jgi:hypothetical protein
MKGKKSAIVPDLETYSEPASLPRNGTNGTGEFPFDWIVPIRFQKPGPKPAGKRKRPGRAFWPLRGPF